MPLSSLPCSYQIYLAFFAFIVLLSVLIKSYQCLVLFHWQQGMSTSPHTILLIKEFMYTITCYLESKQLLPCVFLHPWRHSPGNELIVNHWKKTKMLTKVFQRNLTQWGYVRPLIKPHPNPPWGRPRFRVQSKMAAIKPVIFFLINRSYLKTKHRRATYSNN